MQFGFFFFGGTSFVGPAFLAKTVETGDKNRDDFYCMQMNLVMSMRFIFGDDWNNAQRLSRFRAITRRCAHYDCDALWIQNFQDGGEGREISQVICFIFQ